MKKVIAFIFFLLIFSRCSNDEKVLPSLPHEIGQKNNQHSSHNKINAATTRQVAEVSQEKFENPGKKRRKRIKDKEKGHEEITPKLFSTNTDSLFISRLKYLRSNGIVPDLNEPITKNFLFSPVENQHFTSIITLSPESLIRINFDNDIIDYTDRFFTNGIKIDLITPGFQLNPLRIFMVPYWGSGKNYYGLSLVQNMYTPSTTKIGGILYGDRPYAAYLYFGSFKITNDPVHRFRQTSELDLGIIGPNSYGEWVQRSFHNSVPTNNEPLGWEYQVKNDLVLNYSISLEKGLFSRKNSELIISSAGNAGTLYTNFSGGFLLRAGWMNPYFTNLGIARKDELHEARLRKFQFLFFVKGSGKLVAYDASLEGGIFNTTSSYTLPGKEISRAIFQGSGGISMSYNGFRIDLEQFVLSPEFHNGWWHKWVHVAVGFSL